MTRTAELWKRSWTCGLIALALTLCVVWLAGCNNAPQSDQQLQQKAAKTTEQVKAGAQQAAADAKVAAANAERKVDDIAAGVKEGIHSDTKPSPGANAAGTVDINAASANQLESLPGIGGTRAQRIIDNRPYSSPHDLVSKGIVSEAEYGRISGRIVAD
jgi:DNA uptake protein ComE-like DNA-binding protein